MFAFGTPASERRTEVRRQLYRLARSTSSTVAVMGICQSRSRSQIDLTRTSSESRAQSAMLPRLSPIRDCDGQWASSVRTFSSQYDSRSWPATMATGYPRVYPRYGDIAGAWAPHSSRGHHEFIELNFDVAVYVAAIEIYETYCPGSIVEISALNPDGNHWESMWRGTASPTVTARSRIFSPALVAPPYLVASVRIDLDTRGSRSWSEIDAVRLIRRDTPPDPIAFAVFNLSLTPLNVGAPLGRSPQPMTSDTLPATLPHATVPTPGKLSLSDVAFNHISWPDEYRCPITTFPLLDPVVAADGFTYEAEAITQWLLTSNASPMTNEQLPHKGLTPNRNLRSLILEHSLALNESHSQGIDLAQAQGRRAVSGVGPVVR